MRNPAGVECPYFYGDYYRGRSQERCELLPDGDWQPDLCRTCPVPSIRRANACQHMILRASLRRDWRQSFKKRVKVEAWCEKSQQVVKEPHIGCGACHQLPQAFKVSDE